MSSSHSNQHCDVLIVGGCMVGLCIAHQLLESGISRTITRTIGLERNKAWWSLKNMTFNFLRYLVTADRASALA